MSTRAGKGRPAADFGHGGHGPDAMESRLADFCGDGFVGNRNVSPSSAAMATAFAGSETAVSLIPPPAPLESRRTTTTKISNCDKRQQHRSTPNKTIAPEPG